MTNSLTPKALTLACALAMSAIASAQAADVQKDEAEKKAHVLDAVVVQDLQDENGTTTLTSVQLEMLASPTKTVSDAFRQNSFVQYDNSSRNGSLGGDINPPAISIRGSRNYENSFLINGLSNNSSLNPMGATPNPLWNKPNNLNDELPGGEAQAIVLDTSLLENLTIMSENVSAEYGNFTGGVVNAKLRDAQTDRWHAKLWVRHTRDSWTNTHFNKQQEKKAAGKPLSSSGLQPEFKKSTVGAVFDGPLFDGKLGALLSYEKTHSSLNLFEKTGSKVLTPKKSYRDRETLMLRLNTDKEADFYLSTALIYSPNSAEYFVDGRKNSKNEVEGGGINWTLNSVAKLSVGEWSNDLSISQNHAKWDASNNVENNWINKDIYHDEFFNWVGNENDDKRATEGMHGDKDLEQNTVNFKSILKINPFDIGGSTHAIKLGVEGNYTKVKYDFEGFSSFDNWIIGGSYPNYVFGEHFDPNVQGSKNDGILAGNQWLDKRTTSPGANFKTDYTSIAAFLEDRIQVERFTFRPGVRLEYDDISNDINVAPRFNFEADILADGRFKVNAGLNRYYGNQILSESLRYSRTQIFSKRDNLTDGWYDVDKNGNRIDGSNSQIVDNTRGDLGKLKTPYSDEYVLGGSAKILGNTIFKIQGVYRNYQDQLRTTSKSKLTNEGESEYKGISFGIEKAFDLGSYGKHYAEFGVTRSELTGNSTNLISGWLEDNNSIGKTNPDYISLDGEKTAITDIPASNFNSEWVLTYSHRSFFLDDRLRTTVLVRYETASEGIKDTRKTVVDPNGGPNLRKYETVENDDIFNTDITLDYDVIKTANSTLTISLDALNVFDQSGTYSVDGNAWFSTETMGRQFYLGMTYTY